jgi:hypothetical protein
MNVLDEETVPRR